MLHIGVVSSDSVQEQCRLHSDWELFRINFRIHEFLPKQYQKLDFLLDFPDFSGKILTLRRLLKFFNGKYQVGCLVEQDI